jgi:hypothetical protein
LIVCLIIIKSKVTLFFENVAIDSTQGEKNLYKSSFSNSQWAGGISYFKKNNIVKLIEAVYIEKMAKSESIILLANREKWICEEKVNTTNIRYLILKYKDKQIDLIMIDTKGYDF